MIWCYHFLQDIVQSFWTTTDVTLLNDFSMVENSGKILNLSSNFFRGAVAHKIFIIFWIHTIILRRLKSTPIFLMLTNMEKSIKQGLLITFNIPIYIFRSWCASRIVLLGIRKFWEQKSVKLVQWNSSQTADTAGANCAAITR